MTSANQPKGLRISSRWAKPAVAIGKGTTHLVVTISAPRRKGDGSRQPLDVAFVIDRSGSMSGEPLELAKRGVIEAIQQLRDRRRESARRFSSSRTMPTPGRP